MSTYYERAIKFIKKFSKYIYGYKQVDINEIASYVEWFNEENNRNVKFSYGATRLVFITSDYVIKLDRGDNRFGLEMFGGCEQEMDFYSYAKEKGYEDYFAKIDKYEYDGTNFYIMPRIKFIGTGYWTRGLGGATKYWLANHVNDIHPGNYGFKNGHVVFIDYAAAD